MKIYFQYSLLHFCFFILHFFPQNFEQIFVDNISSPSDIMNGTETYPFNNLSVAIQSFLDRNSSEDYEFFLKSEKIESVLLDGSQIKNNIIFRNWK